MLKINFMIVALAALIPLVIGFIWYHPKVFGTAWMKASGVTPETASGKSMNMALVFGITYIFSFLIAMTMNFVTIHQFGVQSTLLNEPGFTEPGSPMNTYFMDFMANYGHNFRTFKHGAFHGTITGLFMAMPVLGINALFERRGFKYIAINTGYWMVAMGLMGGTICAVI